MSEAPRGAAEVDQATEALSVIVALAGEGRQAFDTSTDRRLALEEQG